MTNATLRKHGFTLVEVLIVVVIMAILAATVIPQFSDSALDAKISSATFNLHALRQQIETYKTHHDGAVPGDTLAELTSKTDRTGTVGTDPNVHIFGPYLKEIPANPFNNSKTVAATSEDPPATEHATAGWLWDKAKGKLWVNSNDPKKLPFSKQ